MAKTRSPNYPAASLGDAIARLGRIYQKETHGKMAPEAAVKHMGYTGINGASLGMLSALKKYGLLQPEGKELRVTPDGVTILVDRPDSPERRAALRNAAFRPVLFADLHDAYGDRVPSEDTLRIYLQKKQFIPEAAAAAAKAYRDTMELVTAQRGEYNQGAEQENGEGNAMHSPAHVQTQPITSQSVMAHQRLASPSTGETERLRLPLSGGRTVRLIFSGSMPTQADIEKLVALLQLSKDSFPISETPDKEISSKG